MFPISQQDNNGIYTGCKKKSNSKPVCYSFSISIIGLVIIPKDKRYQWGSDLPNIAIFHK